MSTPNPVPATPTPAPIVLQPGVPMTLQVTVNGVTFQLTFTLNAGSGGGVSFTVDSKTVTADSANPV